MIHILTHLWFVVHLRDHQFLVFDSRNVQVLLTLD